MKVVSLFTGAGGLDVGLEAAGFSTCVAVEPDASCAATIRRNRPHWTLIAKDIRYVNSVEILRTAGLREGDADLLVGGPPCQPFSKSAYWVNGDTLRLRDPRAATLAEFIRVLGDIMPRAFLLENVPGLGYRGKDEGLALLRKLIGRINDETGTDYRPCIAPSLNAADYGVPQNRRRLFVIGHRDGKPFEFPKPTHAPARLVASNGGLKPYHTAWDAIGDLEDSEGDPSLQLTGKWADLLPSIPEGGNYLFHTSRGGGKSLFGWRRRYWSFLLRLAKDEPSWTITAQPGTATGPFHWQNRRLSRRELLRLQTFPEGYRITGSRCAAQEQIGNSVPCALAEKLGLEIRRQLLGHEHIDGGHLTLLPPRREPVPPPTPHTDVPKKYHHLIGPHEPHPGVGRGPGALSRKQD